MQQYIQGYRHFFASSLNKGDKCIFNTYYLCISDTLLAHTHYIYNFAHNFKKYFIYTNKDYFLTKEIIFPFLYSCPL
jgi:hypothetical protein